MSLSNTREIDFDLFWRYCLELLAHAAAKAKDCKGQDDLPLWNSNMVLAYAAVSWSDHKDHDTYDEWKDDSLAYERKKLNDMKKTISELRRKLNRAKKSAERLKTKNEAAKGRS